MMPAFDKDHPLLKDALKLNVPCVNFGGAVGPSCSFFFSDDLEGGRIVGRLLLNHGHRRIGFIVGPEHLLICKQRYAGLCEAYKEMEEEHDPELIAEGDFSGASGAHAALKLWNKHPEMTALFCANDLMAMGAIMALSQIDVRIPEDVSVVGYDGAFFTAYTNPPLTTIRDNFDRIGIQATEMLLEVLNGENGKKVVNSPTLVERKSVTRARF